MKEYVLKLKEREIELILASLAELPYKVSKGTIDEIVRQVREDNQAEAEIKAEEKE